MNVVEYLLDNDAAIDADGWALIAPFGEHAKTRTLKRDGKWVEEKFIQIVDNEAVDALVSGENTFFRKMLRAVVGIPIFNRGHPDLRDHLRPGEQTLDNSRDKVHLGVIDRVRKSDRGVEAHFVLNNDGADAVEKKGWKFPSALWKAQCVGERAGVILARPFKLLSACLTPNPNIGSVESLANEKERIGSYKQVLKEQLIGALIGLGIPLANDASDSAVVQAVVKTILDNGDYPGHPFHGNQYGEGSAGSKASRSSKDANDATKNALASGSSADHKVAAEIHRRASEAQASKGNTVVAQHHLQMAQMHDAMAKK